MSKTIIVTLPDGSQVGVRPIADGEARVIYREKPWYPWGPPYAQTPEGDNLTAERWQARD